MNQLITKKQNGALNIVIIGLILLGLLGLIVASTYVSQNLNHNSSTNNPSPSVDITSEQAITLDYLSSADIEVENIKNSPDLISIEELPDGSIKYIFKSPLAGRNNILVAKGRSILFKRTVTKTHPGGRLPSLGMITTAPLGDPNQVLKGSRYFGPNYQTYIYSDKGVAVIANPDTGEVQEVQVYPKSDVNKYLSTWGEDIINYTPQVISPI